MKTAPAIDPAREIRPGTALKLPPVCCLLTAEQQRPPAQVDEKKQPEEGHIPLCNYDHKGM